MPRHCILTQKEFQMMMASVRCEKIPGLAELDLTKETQLGPDARDGLVAKKLLAANENGRYGVERKAGYIFSGLGRCEAWVRGDIAYPGGRAARLNLYLLDDAFESVLWRDENALECTWMSNYPLAMGCILHYLNQPGEGALKGPVLPEDAPVRGLLDEAEKELPGAVKAAFAFTEQLTPGRSDVCFYIAAQDGRFYRAYPDVDGMNLVCQPIEELVQDLSQRIFKAHQARIAEVSDGQN